MLSIYYSTNMFFFFLFKQHNPKGLNRKASDDIFSMAFIFQGIVM